MGMSKALKAIRRNVGISLFERTCKCSIFEGRKTKRYKIPGTPEAGRYSMLQRTIFDRMAGRPYYT